MQGTEASVFVPQDRTLRQLMTWRASISGVVLRGVAVQAKWSSARSPTTSTSRAVVARCGASRRGALQGWV
jgi:hypothetical protein